jgi:Fur family peroxide stress response transcriptional regulator
MKKAFAIGKLRELGYKITPQREYVLDLFLNSKEHPSAEALYGMVKERFPYISLSTVYNTLNTLVDIGLAKTIYLEDKTYFDPNLEPHSHFICEHCGSIYDMEPVSIDLSSVKNDNIARTTSVEVFLYGVCKNCINVKAN